MMNIIALWNFTFTRCQVPQLTIIISLHIQGENSLSLLKTRKPRAELKLEPEFIRFLSSKCHYLDFKLMQIFAFSGKFLSLKLVMFSQFLNIFHNFELHPGHFDRYDAENLGSAIFFIRVLIFSVLFQQIISLTIDSGTKSLIWEAPQFTSVL